MARVVRLHRFGGPEVLVEEVVPDAPPGPGEIRIRQTAIGVNFTDVHGRRGDYANLRALPLPIAIGMEAAGIVEAVGPDVARLRAGDRVAYASAPLGSYASHRNMPATRCVRVPEGVDDRTVAASLLKGMTLEYLLRRVHRVQKGEWIVFHAAAGGVGTLAGQWLRALGAHAIGIVGSAAKEATARAAGYAHVFVHGRDDWPNAARRLSDGAGVAAVYDSVGQATWEGSIACLAPRGYMVCFGNSSGLVPPISVNSLRDRGSLRLTWTRLSEYTATVEELDACAAEVFEALQRGILRPRIHAAFPLARAADAHAALESRATDGSLVLLP
ncbi:MAG: quinone oxidoreductase [Alphaproteobacteria bacterium]|nr:quinone oxidoreductase [Alphaproteobacteria bacterium]